MKLGVNTNQNHYYHTHTSHYILSYTLSTVLQFLSTSATFLNTSPVGSIMNGGMISDG